MAVPRPGFLHVQAVCDLFLAAVHADDKERNALFPLHLAGHFHIFLVFAALAALAGTSFVVDGTWGGFYLWKSKNENRAKYAQKFVRLFAKEYGVENAIRLAEIVLKD